MLTCKGSTWFGPIYQVWTSAICQTPLAICPQSNGTARIQIAGMGWAEKRSRPEGQGPTRVRLAQGATSVREAGRRACFSARRVSGVELRSRRCFRVIEEAFANARERFGFRVIEFSVLGNHLHLLVEADSDASLARGMQGLTVRMQKR